MTTARARGYRERVKVVVTGFGPFEDVALNASGEVARALADRVVAGFGVVAEVLETAFGAARARVGELAAAHAPRAFCALGVSRDPFVRLERRAAGAVASARADVAGEVWLGRELGGERVAQAAFDRWLEAARAVDAEARGSEDCGGYVCNAVYQAVLAAAGDEVPALFVHIPRDLDAGAIAARVALVEAVITAMVVSR